MFSSRPNDESDLQKKTNAQLLSIAKDWADLSIALHYWPKGWIWSDRLSTGQIGLYGTISSIISIYKSMFY